MKALATYFLLLISVISYSQQQNDSVILNELGFVNHLIDLQDYKASIHILKDINSQSAIINDSCNYLLAWSYYNSKGMDSASYYFSKINTSNSNYNKSVFLSSFCKTTLKDYNTAKTQLSEINLHDKNLNELRSLQLGGISLLERDISSFDSLSSSFTYNYYPLVECEQNLNTYAQEIRDFKPRSMFVAGALSSVIPGMGKVYMGKYGEGAAAFLMVSIMGIVTYENYRADGLLDPKTILFGGMFATYYIGNIWGSSIGVKIRRDEFYNEIDYKILFDIHIPLRTVFN